jgi:hypothetical protein
MRILFWMPQRGGELVLFNRRTQLSAALQRAFVRV